MNVAELTAALQKENPAKMVVRSGYEGGCEEVSGLHQGKIALNVNTAWYYGPHEEADEGTTDAVFID